MTPANDTLPWWMGKKTITELTAKQQRNTPQTLAPTHRKHRNTVGKHSIQLADTSMHTLETNLPNRNAANECATCHHITHSQLPLCHVDMPNVRTITCPCQSACACRPTVGFFAARHRTPPQQQNSRKTFNCTTLKSRPLPLNPPHPNAQNWLQKAPQNRHRNSRVGSWSPGNGTKTCSKKFPDATSQKTARMILLGKHWKAQSPPPIRNPGLKHNDARPPAVTKFFCSSPNTKFGRKTQNAPTTTGPRTGNEVQVLEDNLEYQNLESL